MNSFKLPTYNISSNTSLTFQSKLYCNQNLHRIKRPLELMQESPIHCGILMQLKFKLYGKICNCQSLLSMIYDIVNNNYRMFNSKTLPLQFIGVNQYLLDNCNELYLQSFNLFINVNDNQYYYTNTDTYNIFTINSNLSIINNKENKSENFINSFRISNILHLNTILHCISNGEND